MTRTASQIALCSAVAFAAAEDVPEWVHLLPAGEIRTVDGRGPYRVKSLQNVMARSLQGGAKLPIDECHVTDKGAALGLAAPARGWIVELQAREDGVWGRVEWNSSGQQLMADKAYIGLSPVILHSRGGDVMQLLRASLTNTPNLQGLTTLHSESNTMDWKAKLIELLGLDSNADDAAIEAALTAKMSGGDKALCAADILGSDQFVALQSELTGLATKYNALVEDGRKGAATAYVDGAIAEGRIGLKPVRDEYIALHMADADRAVKLISAMPKIGGGSAAIADGDPAGRAAAQEFGAEDRLVMSLFGIDEDEYRDELKARGLQKEVL